MRLSMSLNIRMRKATLALSVSVALLLTILLPIAMPARAADADNNVSLLAFSAGMYDVLEQKDEAAEARIEYRAAQKFWLFKPFGGLMATSDGSAHAFAGLLVDIDLPSNFVLTPSFAPGLYHEGGGKDLGHVIEFRSQIELSYRFQNRSRLGLSINHLSNMGLSDANPGVESIAVTYALPIAGLFAEN